MTEYCPQCGAPLPENCLFCPACGASCARPSGPAPETADSAPAITDESAAPAGEPAPEQPPAGETASSAPESGPVPPPPGAGPRYAAQPPRYTPSQPAPDKNEMTTGRYLACLILFAIPVVGLVMMFVWGFGSGENVHRRRLARAALLFVALLLVLCVLFSIVMAAVGALGFWLFPRGYGYYQGPYDYFEDYLDGYDDYYDYYYDDPYGYYGGHHLGARVQ